MFITSVYLYVYIIMFKSCSPCLGSVKKESEKNHKLHMNSLLKFQLKMFVFFSNFSPVDRVSLYCKLKNNQVKQFCKIDFQSFVEPMGYKKI